MRCEPPIVRQKRPQTSEILSGNRLTVLELNAAEFAISVDNEIYLCAARGPPEVWFMAASVAAPRSQVLENQALQCEARDLLGLVDLLGALQEKNRHRNSRTLLV